LLVGKGILVEFGMLLYGYVLPYVVSLEREIIEVLKTINK
jgi:hypothetical protein